METFILAIFTLASKTLGLLRDVLLANKYGATSVTDVFIISISVPVVLLESISSAILVNYIPIITELKTKKAQKEIARFNGVLLFVLLIAITVGVGIFYILGKPIMHLFAIGFEGEKLELLVRFSKITILASYFIILGDVFKAHCQGRGNFYSTAISSVLVNIAVIVGIAIPNANSIGIVIAFLIGNALSFCVLFADARRNNILIIRNIEFRNSYLIKILILSIPIFLNNAIWELNGIIDKSLVSTLGEGFVTSLNYANKITSIIVGIVTASVATVVYPKYSQAAAGQGNLKDLLFSDLNKVVKILAPICVFCALKAENVVNLVFFSNSFSTEMHTVVVESFRLYSIGMIFACLKPILFKYYYAQQNTKTPAINTAIAILLNIILNIILIRFFNYKGIIAATVISSFITVALLFFNIGKGVLRKTIKFISYGFVFSTVSALIILLLNIAIYDSGSPIKTILYGTIYVGLFGLYFMKYDREVFKYKG